MGTVFQSWLKIVWPFFRRDVTVFTVLTVETGLDQGSEYTPCPPCMAPWSVKKTPQFINIWDGYCWYVSMAADGITLPHRDVLLTASQVMGELSVVCLWGCQSSSSVCIWEKGRAHSSVDSWSEGNWRMERTFHKLTGLWCNNWMNRVTLSISISHDWVYQQWNIQANVTWLHAPILKTRLHTYLYKQTNYIYFFKSNNMQNKNVQGV